MLQEHERKIYRLEIRVEALEKDNGMLKDQLSVYQASSVANSRKLDSLLIAIVGDDSLKTTGLMQRIESIEKVTNFIMEMKWKILGGLIVVGWGWAFGGWVLDKFLK